MSSSLNAIHPDNRLRISGIVNDSIVDGPGMRYVVFVQGCYHNCEGCHNKHTHDPLGGKFMSVEDILDEIKKNPLLDGVTFSGGEPFQQAGVLATLGRKIKDYDPNLSIITYSGYVFEHLLKESEKDMDYLRLLTVTDFLIDGPFKIDKKSLDCPFRGSYNQRYLDCTESMKQKTAIEVEEYKWEPKKQTETESDNHDDEKEND